VPIKRAAYKDLRKAGSRHSRNISIKSEMKTLVKNFERLLAAKKTDEAARSIANIVSKIDRAASKGVIKQGAASRKISRLMKKLSRGLSKA